MEDYASQMRSKPLFWGVYQDWFRAIGFYLGKNAG